MSDFASALLLELGRATLALTLAAGLALVVLRLAGLQSPRLHRALWLLALLVGWTFGGVSVAIPWQRVEQAREESPAIVASLPPLASDALVELNVHAPPASEATPLEMPLLPVDATPRNFAAPLEFSASPSAEANQAPGERVGLMHRLASLPWPLLVVIAWLAGIGALMAIWLFGYIRFVRAIQVGAHGSERCDEAWQQQWKLLLKQHSVRRPIAMRVTVDTGPLLCRLPRGYELLIPAALWTSLDPAERQSVLQHELAHYLRGDLAKSLVARILALPHWFNPCAWLAVRRFDEAAEWACDQAAAAPAEVTTYARALVRLGEVHLTTRYGSAARTRPLASRVRRLLKFQQKDSTMKTSLIVAAALCLAALAVVRVQLVAREPEAAKVAPSQPMIVTIEASPNDASPTVEPYLNLPQDEQPQPTSQRDETVENLFKEPVPASAEDERVEELAGPKRDGDEAIEETTSVPIPKASPRAPKAAPRVSQKAVEAAREAYQAALKSYEAEQMTLEEVCNWSKRWLTAATAVATKSPQRVKGAEQHLERMKLLQERIHKLNNLGSRGGDHQQVTAINFYVAEAEGEVVYEQAKIGDAKPLVVSGEAVIMEEVVEQLPDGQQVRRKLPRVIRVAPNPDGSMPKLVISTPATSQQPIPSSRASAPGTPTAIPNASKPATAAPRAVPAATPQLAVPSEAPARAVPALEPPRAVRAEAPTVAVPAKAPPLAVLSAAEPSLQPTSRERVELPEATFLTPNGEADKRSRLRYDGKSFSKWKEELANELSTAKRTQAVWALMAFGNNGYGKEAAQTIMDLMGSYSMPATNPSMKSDELSNAALTSFGRLPHDAALPVVLAGLKSDNARQRAFAVRVLPIETDDPREWKPLLVSCLSDADPQVRAFAVTRLGTLSPQDPDSQAAVLGALVDPDRMVIQEGVRIIATNSKRPNPHWADRLVDMLDHHDAWAREAAMEALRSLGVASLAALATIENHPDSSIASKNARQLEQEIRKQADANIKVNLENFEGMSEDVDESLRETFRHFGLYAIPALENATTQTKNPDFAKRLQSLMTQIRADAANQSSD